MIFLYNVEYVNLDVFMSLNVAFFYFFLLFFAQCNRVVLLVFFAHYDKSIGFSAFGASNSIKPV